MGGRGSGPKRDAERDQEMARLRAEGLTLAEIGRRLGLTRQAVKAALDRLGEPARGRGGFAALSAGQRRRIASLGGKAAHAKGAAHRFTSATAAAAGREGARVAHQRGTAHRFTSEEASAAGKKGGKAKKKRKAAEATDEPAG
jgi:hypothetical protein